MATGPGGRERARPASDGDAFAARWNALPANDRRRIRRLVRLGRPVANGVEADLAVAYARFQRARIWIRFFWLWFVPGAVIVLGVALRIHLVLVGAILALASQAAYAWVNLVRTAKRGTYPTE